MDVATKVAQDLTGAVMRAAVEAAGRLAYAAVQKAQGVQPAVVHECPGCQARGSTVEVTCVTDRERVFECGACGVQFTR